MKTLLRSSLFALALVGFAAGLIPKKISTTPQGVIKIPGVPCGPSCSGR